MTFQDQLVAINVGNVSPNHIQKKRKKEAAAKVLLTMLAKMRALYCLYKLVVRVRLPSKMFFTKLGVETTK